MPSSLLPWLAAAVAAAAAGLLELRRGRSSPPQARGRPLGLVAALVLALGGVLAGLAIRSWRTAALPGGTAADGLAMLAAGVLVAAAWAVLRGAPGDRTVCRATSLWPALFGAAVLLGVAILLAWRVPSPIPVPQAGSWLYGLRGLLAGIGTGGWIAALAASILWVARLRHGPASPAGDPGRDVALCSYPWLTAACLAGGLWSMGAYASPWRGVAAEAWLVVTWLTGGAYLIATSAARPLRLPAWVPLLLAAAAALAALAAALTAPTLLDQVLLLR